MGLFIRLCFNESDKRLKQVGLDLHLHDNSFLQRENAIIREQVLVDAFLTHLT